MNSGCGIVCFPFGLFLIVADGRNAYESNRIQRVAWGYFPCLIVAENDWEFAKLDTALAKLNQVDTELWFIYFLVCLIR